MPWETRVSDPQQDAAKLGYGISRQTQRTYVTTGLATQTDHDALQA